MSTRAALAVALAAALVTSACAGRATRSLSAEPVMSQSDGSSEGSSEGSDGSSKGSQASGEASRGSGDASKGSADASKGTGESSDRTFGDSSQGTGEASQLASSVTVAVVLVAGVAALIYMVAGSGSALAQRREAARAFLQRHRRPLRVALSRGSGPIVDDLAMLLRLPPSHVGALGLALKDHRGELDGYLSDAEVTQAEADGFARAMIAALGSRPELEPWVEATRERARAVLEAEQEAQ